MASTQGQTWLTNGLLGYYPMDGNPSDTSGNGRHFVENSVTYGTNRFGAASSSVRITNVASAGRSHLSTYSYASLTVTGFTFSFWGLFEPTFSIGQAQYIFALGVNADRRFAIRSVNNDIVSVELTAGGKYYDTYSYHPTYSDGTGRNLFLNQDGWQHYALVYDGVNLKFYRAGQEFLLKDRITSSFSITGAFTFPSNYPLMLGKGFFDFTENGVGALVDDVRIYNRPLSAGEIALLGLGPCNGPRRALARGNVANGMISGIYMTDGGCGYTNNPMPVVTISGGGGSGAVAQAEVSNGQVVGVTIVSPGSGYTVTPTITISLPPRVPKLYVNTTRVRVTMDLTAGLRYQLQASSNLTSWANIGTPFTALTDQLSQDFDVDTTGRHFRIQEVP
jgi:hypothetical protein